MNCVLDGHDFRNEVFTIVQIFFPNVRPIFTHEVSNEGLSIKTSIHKDEISACVMEDGNKKSEHKLKASKNNLKHIKNRLQIAVYTVLSDFTGIKSKWGILIGIRPAKILRNLMEKGLTQKEIYDYMKSVYLCSDEKIDLSIKVAEKEKAILSGNDGKDKSLYIGIPFCPTRCLYCSFTAYPIKKYESTTEPYLEALFKEMEYAKEYFAKSRLENIYIGGGTPTSLDEKSLEKLLYTIRTKFDFSYIKEFCVEAGRPDTINKEKLKLFKKYNVSRISVNPQTMNDKTLKLIGRRHSVSDFLNAYHLARGEGFDNINIDLILGLPGETMEDVSYTFNEIEKLSPKSVTVHTLAIKRASRLKEELSSYNFVRMKEMEDFLHIASSSMERLHLEPYYMYRQKNMVGNFENVGYAEKGYEGVYNVQIMEEKQDILALGAGATTKYVNLDTNRIERAFNVKEPLEYINRIDEMIERKKRLEEILC
jgi:oxygen-independent coproporphyrinogen-3 oxidase